MKINVIKEIAKQHNLKFGKTNKCELVRAIQQAEGNYPCFNSSSSAACGQHTYLWREDCH